MKFHIRDAKGVEQGPFDEEALRKLVGTGTISADTAVRNSLMKHWKAARELEFLRSSFERRAKETGDEELMPKSVTRIPGGNFFEDGEQGASSIFRHEYLPQPAPLSLRIGATLVDLLVLAVPVGVMFALYVLAVAGGVAGANSGFYFFLAAALATVLAYYGFTLGFLAQTLGMWFWGTLIVGAKLEEVLPFRAFVYTLLMPILGILTPITAFVHPQGKSPQELLTGAWIIRTAAKPKV